MSRDEIIRMVREAGGFDATPEFLETFAALVAAPLKERIQDLYQQIERTETMLDDEYKMGMEAEREACAKVCDELAAKDKLSNYYAVAARATRARGQA